MIFRKAGKGPDRTDSIHFLYRVGSLHFFNHPVSASTVNIMAPTDFRTDNPPALRKSP